MPSIESARAQINTIRYARVAQSYPDKHCVDLVFLDDGGFATGVPVATHSASQAHGFAYLPEIQRPADGKWSAALAGTDDVLAAVAWTGPRGVSCVLGFFFPVGGSMGQPANQLMEKHISGMYRRIEANGDLLIYHPAGYEIAITKRDGIRLQANSAVVRIRPDGKIYLN